MPFLQKLKKLDWIAMIVFFAGTTCFTCAVSFGGSVYAFKSGPEIVFWVMAGTLLIAMAFVTVYHPLVSKEHRLYPGHFLRRPVLVNLQLQLFIITGVMLGTAYYIPLYFQFTRGDSALKAAVRLLPFISMVVVFSFVNGGLMPKFGYYMPWYTFGSALVLIGSALMYTVNSSTPTSAVYGYTVIIGVGAGCYLQAGYSVVQILVSPADIGNVVGFMSVGQDVGIVVLLSIAGTVYNNIALAKVRAVLSTASPTELQLIIAGTSNSVFQALTDDLREKVIVQITSAMSDVWAVIMAFGALSFVLSLSLGVTTIALESAHRANCSNRGIEYTRSPTLRQGSVELPASQKTVLFCRTE